MFSMMTEAREEVVMERNEERTVIKGRDKKTLEAGARVLSKFISSGEVVLSDDEDGSSVDGSSNGEREGDAGGDRVEMGRKKKRVVNHGLRFEGKMDKFDNMLTESGKAQRGMEAKKMGMEEGKMDTKERMRRADREERRVERQEERQERAEERESRDKLEIETFRMIIEMLKETRK